MNRAELDVLEIQVEMGNSVYVGLNGDIHLVESIDGDTLRVVVDQDTLDVAVADAELVAVV